MWLLDANMYVHLTRALGEHGIRSEAATRRGWGGLGNGELVAAARKAGFTCIPTQDRLFATSATRILEEHPSLCIVVVHIAQRPWREYVEQFREAWTSEPITPMPGRVLQWPTRPATGSGGE